MSYKQKYTLDTSVLFENIKQPENQVKETLDSIASSRRYCLHHSLIEFKLGLLQTWVRFYLQIQATRDIQKSIIDISNSFKLRQKNYKFILEKLMHQLCDSIPTKDVDMYLANVEYCIIYAEESIEYISTKYFGSFAEHPIVRHTIASAADFESFINVCDKESIVDIESLVIERQATFSKLLSHMKVTKYSAEDKKSADTVIKLLTEAVATPSRCNMVSKNKKYGDIIISVDSPRDYIIITKDKLFNILCAGLKKRAIVTTFDRPVN